MSGRLGQQVDRTLIRARRFVRTLRSSLRSWTRARRRALAHPADLGIVKALRRAWIWSAPDFPDKLWGEDEEAQAQLTAEEGQLSAEQAAEERAWAAQRARRRIEGPVVYEGALVVRPVYRGMRVDIGRPADLEDWLAQEPGLDASHGEIVRVRLTAELLPGPRAPDE